MGKKLQFKSKSYIYLQPREELVLDTIIRVLSKAKYHQMGTTALIKTVQESIGIVESGGNKGHVQKNTILKGIYMLLAIQNSSKAGTRRILKIWEIKRKRIIKLLPQKTWKCKGCLKNSSQITDIPSVSVEKTGLYSEGSKSLESAARNSTENVEKTILSIGHGKKEEQK